jgi:uncharacterized membrane protein (UPF0127 family)
MIGTMKKILSILIILLVTNLAFAIEYKHYCVINGNKILLEEAITQKQKNQGLMGRNYLKTDTGMVFFYTSYVEQSFWMKNTQIPLDIIFLKDGKVMRLYKNAEPCKTEICKIYPSRGIVNQVIELNAGSCSKYGIKKGSIIRVKELE